MDQALLLGACGRVVGGVKVGDKDAVEPAEHLPDDLPFACGSVGVNNLLQVREGPDISTVPLERYLGLVGVDQVPASELLFQPLVCGGVSTGRPGHSPPHEMVAGRETEDLVEAQIHVLVCLTHRHVVVEDPTGEVVADPDSDGSVLVGQERALARPAPVPLRAVPDDPSPDPRGAELQVENRLVVWLALGNVDLCALALGTTLRPATLDVLVDPERPLAEATIPPQACPDRRAGANGH